MKKYSRISAIDCFSLVLVLVFLSAGCGQMRRYEQKLEQRWDDRPPGHLHSVTISWTASTSRVAGYNLYRSSSPGFPIQKLNSRPIAGTEFTDTTAVGGYNYTYYATSLDAKGIESKPSVETTVLIPYP